MAKDGPFKPTPQEDALGQEPVDLISDGGQRALAVIDEVQARLEPFILVTNALDPRDLAVYHHYSVHLRIDDSSFPPRLGFGNLGDPKKPSEITLMAARQMYPLDKDGLPAHATTDGARLVYKNQILFGKNLALELLSKVKPGETVRMEGEGICREYSEIRSRHDELADDSTVNYDFKHSDSLKLELGLSKDSRRVDFRFTVGQEATRELTFEKGRILRAPKYSNRFIPHN